jgi:hypothetical protein
LVTLPNLALGCPGFPKTFDTICLLPFSHCMVNSVPKITKIFFKGSVLGLPLFTVKNAEIKRILKIYKGKTFQTNFSILLCKNNLSAKIESTGVIAEVQTLL